MQSNVYRFRTAVTAWLLMAMAGAPSSAQDQTARPDGYGINPGDVLVITVWKEEDLQRQALVLPDGSISFPLAGDIQAAGKTVAEIRAALTERLSEYIPEPVVTVTVEEASGNMVYVLGQVQRPGGFVAGRQLDVAQALAMAGGFTAFAQVNDIKVLRRQDGNLSAMDFRYNDIEKGKQLDQNILLQPGDVVIVP